MNGHPDAQQTAKQWAVDMLRGNPNRTEADIRATVKKAVQAIRLFGNQGDVDSEQLVAELLHTFSITAERGTALYDDRNHIAWLPEKRAKMAAWPLWERYMIYLERDSGIPPDVVNRIHADTDLVLERLEDPARPGEWSRRGMVVGSVQSGKTGNYIGLINKALDAGYKLVIVLAGRHNNLRSQTQLRIDEGVLGLDTKRERALNRSTYKIGVAHYGTPEMVVNYGTTSTEDGDFKLKRAQAFGVRPGRDPVILVIKKEPTALKNVLDWLRHLVAETKDGSNKMFIRGIPLLLIDDEADNASINTKDKRGHDTSAKTVSSINGSIRKILSSFEKAAYVGYTATPFANVFIDPDAVTDEHGKDIFPESFIINIKAPSNYVGPARVFGLDGDTDAGIEAHAGLPVVQPLRMVPGPSGEPADDYGAVACFPPKHNKQHVPSRLPQKLCYAIRCFILACAARRARGQERKHNSMLVHVSRFQSVQGITTTLLREELIPLQRRLKEGDGKRSPTLRDELHDIWLKDFVPISKALGDEAGKVLTWAQVNAELDAAAAKIEVMTINGFAKQVLDYKEYEETGRSVIAVGGDKLSRGLTLEGLSVSYFLRTSKMYDTLMQMGRWFGYRPGYLDLCRLFTTTELVEWYRHIALAEAELRREFDYMVQAGFTPANYGLRVRTHPDGMIITALNKMPHTQKLELSWAGVLVQTTQLSKAAEDVSGNLVETATFLAGLSGVEGSGLAPRIWRGVGALRVARYVAKLKYPAESARASGSQLSSFIEKQEAQGELKEWTVVLVSNRQADEKARRDIAGHRIGLVRRTPESQTASSWALRKANILSPEDESLDLRGTKLTAELAAELAVKPALRMDAQFLLRNVDNDLHQVAVLLTRKRIEEDPQRWRGKADTERPNGRIVRELRPKSHGLLLIYPLRQPDVVPMDKELGRPEEKTGLDPNSTPAIGLALSFPTSETAVRVEYRVGKVWLAQMQDDEAYGDDD